MENIAYTADQLALILRAQRKGRKLTQKAAAKRVGLLPKTISALEAAPENSSIASLYKLLSALDLELVIRAKNRADDDSGESELEW